MIKLIPILKQVLKEEDDEWDLEAGPEWNLTPDQEEFLNIQQFFPIVGISNGYLEDMGGIESGSDEWMNLIQLIVGKDPFDMDNWDKEDNDKVTKLISILEKNGIELV